jgi:2'-hydroxyisoflavone reductase
LKLLVIGGTQFAGRHVVEAALAAGHQVTLFNRGRRNPGLFPEAEHLVGDRRGDLSVLQDRRWDVVVDPSGYVPSVVQRSAVLLSQAVHYYCFISTVSVYPDPGPSADETAPLASVTPQDLARAEAYDPDARSSPGGGYGEAYGGLKAQCERSVLDALPGRTMIVRPGFILGPYDYSNRYPYWIERIMRGGTVLAPGAPDRQVRVIDMRDIAAWILCMAETRVAGVFNATGAGDLTMRALLEGTRDGIGADARFAWVPEAGLLEHGVEPFADLPFWVPQSENAIFDVPNDRAIAAGLRFRPLSTTAADTAAWRRSLAPEKRNVGCLSSEREARLLDGLHLTS